jgi:SAM-dependent methyltransferase
MDLGCGDGTTSFIMLDGTFGPEFDVFHSVQAGEQNILSESRREYSGSLADHTGDFYNNYDPAWSRYLTVTESPGWTYGIGLDWKEPLLQKSRDVGIYKSLVRHDANESLPFPDASQDFVFSTIIYWIADTQSALQEVSRVLKPGGIFAFSCPDLNITQYTLASMLKQYAYPAIQILERGRHSNWERHAQDRTAWDNNLASVGLRVVEYKRFHSALQILLGETTIRPLLRAYDTLYQNLLPHHYQIFLEFKTTWVEEVYRLLEPATDAQYMKNQEMLYHAYVVEKSNLAKT